MQLRKTGCLLRRSIQRLSTERTRRERVGSHQQTTSADIVVKGTTISIVTIGTWISDIWRSVWMASRILESTVFPRIGRHWTLWKPMESKQGGSSIFGWHYSCFTATIDCPLNWSRRKQKKAAGTDSCSVVAAKCGWRCLGCGPNESYGSVLGRGYLVLGTFNVPGKPTRGSGTSAAEVHDQRHCGDGWRWRDLSSIIRFGFVSILRSRWCNDGYTS